MADTPSPDKDTNELPEPEVLKPQEAEPSQTAETPSDSSKLAATRASRRLKRGTYRPSHKATFTGLAVVVAILAVNAAIIGFVIRGQSSSKSQINKDQVTISSSTLSKLGVNQTTIGTSGVKLVVNPDALFNGKLQVNGDVTLAGQLKLNSKFTATDASLTQLEAGKTALSDLNVNGDATATNIIIRSDLTVSGKTSIQGAATFSQLTTINNSLNVSGNLAVGGTLSIATFHTGNIVVDGSTILGGHIITQGSAPSYTEGSSAVLSATGHANLSGNDQAGTIGVTVGVGGASSAGILINVTFHNKYSNIPHVVISVVGPGAPSVYVNRSATGFSIGVNSPLAAGSYAFDYIVEQ